MGPKRKAKTSPSKGVGASKKHQSSSSKQQQKQQQQQQHKDIPACAGYLIACDVPTKQYIQYLNELKPVDKKFILEDLDSTHLLVKLEARKEIERKVEAWMDEVRSLALLRSRNFRNEYPTFTHTHTSIRPCSLVLWFYQPAHACAFSVFLFCACEPVQVLLLFRRVFGVFELSCHCFWSVVVCCFATIVYHALYCNFLNSKFHTECLFGCGTGG